MEKSQVRVKKDKNVPIPWLLFRETGETVCSSSGSSKLAFLRTARRNKMFYLQSIFMFRAQFSFEYAQSDVYTWRNNYLNNS